MSGGGNSSPQCHLLIFSNTPNCPSRLCPVDPYTDCDLESIDFGTSIFTSDRKVQCP